MKRFLSLLVVLTLLVGFSGCLKEKPKEQTIPLGGTIIAKVFMSGEDDIGITINNGTMLNLDPISIDISYSGKWDISVNNDDIFSLGINSLVTIFRNNSIHISKSAALKIISNFSPENLILDAKLNDIKVLTSLGNTYYWIQINRFPNSDNISNTINLLSMENVLLKKYKISLSGLTILTAPAELISTTTTTTIPSTTQ